MTDQPTAAPPATGPLSADRPSADRTGIGRTSDPRQPAQRTVAPQWVGVGRVIAGVGIVLLLAYSFGLRSADGDANPLNYFGYFTNLTCLLASFVAIATGMHTFGGRPAPIWLSTTRGVSVANLTVVGVIYNTVVPGTGEAPVWVSGLLHLAVPIGAALDWAFFTDRPALPWRRLWLVLPYPAAWLVIVLARGATDGWVPYGFLLPERGAWPIVLTVIGLIALLVVAGAVTWTLSRLRGTLGGSIDAEIPTDRSAR